MRGTPWMDEVLRRRSVEVLRDDDSADAVIVGGGISGLTAAYGLLEGSDRQVLLLEKDLVGHGATGHNGGQAVAAFERSYDELSQMAGQERTLQGYRELTEGWDILAEMLRSMGSEDMLQMVPGQLGLSTVADLRAWSADMARRRENGLPSGRIRVADDVRIGPHEVADLELAYRDVIEDLLWTRDHRYLAAIEMAVGLMNSYQFTERMAENLLAKHADRFRLMERSPVDRIRLNDEEAVIQCNGRTVVADQAVLCTNGYRLPRIEACSVPAILGQIRGVVGYMIGEVQEQGVPGARVFFRGGGEDEPYFYLTSRRHQDAWLTAVGGPEGPLRGEIYEPGTNYNPGAYQRLGSFMKETLINSRGQPQFQWQGLMGYTPTAVRVVGADPRLPTLFYDLGCNGIGILSAVAGSRRLINSMEGRHQGPSIFDPEMLDREGVKRSVQRVR